MFGIGPTELIIILIIALVIFGPGKLPELGAGLGRALREFQKASREIQNQIDITETEADAKGENEKGS